MFLLHLLNIISLVRLDTLSQICTLVPELYNFDKRTDLAKFTDESMFKTMEDLAPTFEETFEQVIVS